jgi:MFS family permease
MQAKFSGWSQLAFVSVIVGMTAQYGSTALSLSNAIMRSGVQVTMTATAFGIGATLYSLMQGPPQIIIGAWIKKQGTRKVFLLGIPFLVIVTLGISNFLNTDISYIIIFGVLWGLSYMFVSQIAAQTLVNNWFIQRRGQAISIMNIIGCVFSFISPFIVQRIIQSKFAGGSFKFGWYSIGVFGILSFVFVFFLKDKPEDIGQHPDGVEPSFVIETKKAARVSTVFKVGTGVQATTVKEALKKPMFWIMLICAGFGFAISMVGFAVASVHFLDNGYDMSILSSAMAWRSLARLVFVLIAVKILDRIEPAIIFGFGFLASGVLTIIAANPSGSVIIYAYFSMSMIWSACLATALPTMLANVFGRESFPALQGICLTVGGLISSTTGTIAGLIADTNGGSYSIAFIVYAIVAFVGCVFSVFGIGIPCVKKYRQSLASSN